MKKFKSAVLILAALFIVYDVGESVGAIKVYKSIVNRNES